MKKFLNPVVLAGTIVFLFTACQKDVKEVPQSEEISPTVMAQIKSLGFSTRDVQKVEEGYLVEGDIILTNEQLLEKPTSPTLVIASEEQYRTNNLVTGLPRTITVSMDSKLRAIAGYLSALNEMVNRYNARNLRLTFAVVEGTGGNIHFVNANGPYLASAGFPTNSGNPYSQVKIYSRNLGSGTSTTFINFAATVFAHEVGHCIGFRHTDYMDRSYSCGGATSNEGASTVGAVHIPGTPTGPDPNSWMLACISRNENRPFNANDRTALDYLY